MSRLFEHICAYDKKLDPFQVQFGTAMLTYCMCLAARKMEFPHLDSSNYAASVQKLRDDFTSWFPEFRQDEMNVKFFAQPFDLAVEDSPDDCQMELIELQADIDIKRGYPENSLADFYKRYVEGFPISSIMQEE